MKKTLLVLLIALVSLSIFAPQIYADQLADSNDIFYVNTPTPNQKVAGTVNVSWRMYDNNQSIIPYSVKLFDGATCKTTFYGNINANGSGLSSQTQDNTISWNTKTTQSNSNIQDGNYCLQICGAFKQGTSPYSACNLRIVSIINDNKGPVINSSPSNLTIHESDSWQYQLQAVDQGGRPLHYYFISGTNFLSINSQTGLIQTNSNSKALAPGVTRADYNIIVAADDSLYYPATQQFTLSIIKNIPPPSSSSSSVSSQSSSSSSSSISSS